MRRKLALAAKVLAGIAVFGVLAAVFFAWVILPRLDTGGADITPFAHDRDLTISKTAPSGIPYTVNNSTATFHLDIAKPDSHCTRVFSTYADASQYGQKHGLPILPSVQIIQGKLKAFDDQLCTALERAMQRRQRQALESLLKRLIANHAPSEAVIHVGTALSLSGFEPEGLDGDTRQHVETSRTQFLSTPDAQPCGFWEEHEDLKKAYPSDRYLMHGFALHESAEACIALSRAIAEDAALKAAFLTLREFGAKLTNPTEDVPFEEIAGLTPRQLCQRFPADSRFALIAHSTSQEANLVRQLRREQKLTGRENLMPLIIDAVRSGRLSLDPKPDSGWYDYQWHALETLLAPERGHESAKLKTSAAYRKRLEHAFSSILTKERETHIKRLPIPTLGMNDSDPLPKVALAPDFSAEPTLTVYLRLGRGYRFLRQALRATLQEDWPDLHLPDSPRSLDSLLNETALFCYGIYETLCLEIGQQPHYLPGELDALDREQAAATFTRWRETWPGTPALTNDTRAAVPVGRRTETETDRRIRYWATAGVRLEAAIYTYRDAPTVKGAIEPEFVPRTVYLPTDLFIEFETDSPAPLTRATFRSLCDACPDVPAILKTFGCAPPASAGTRRFPALSAVKNGWGWIMAAGAGLLFWTVRRTRPWILFLSAALMTGWGCLFAFSPHYRTSFLVRRIARINTSLGLLCEGRILSSTPFAPVLKALAALHDHPDPQVRYLAARFIADSSRSFSDTNSDTNAWFQTGVKDDIMRAVNDPDAEIATHAVYTLKNYRDPAVTDLLLSKLATAKFHDELCQCIIHSLGSAGDPRAIEAILPFCEDPRPSVCAEAIRALGLFPQPEAQAYLWQLAESPVSPIRFWALLRIKENCAAWWAPQMDKEASLAKFDERIMERINCPELSFDIRRNLANVLISDRSAMQASAVLLEAADSPAQSNAVLSRWVGRYTAYFRSPEYVALSNFLNQSSLQLELADAVRSQDSAVVTQALVNIMSNASTNDAPDLRSLAGGVLRRLQKKQSVKPDAR